MISEKLEALLLQLEESGDSQKLAVADCLRTIASNGDEQATDKFIACCANELGQAAMELRNQLCGIYTEEIHDMYYEDWAHDAAKGDTHRGYSDWVYKRMNEEEADNGDEEDNAEDAIP